MIFLKKLLFLVLIAIAAAGCATVSDNVATLVDEEQYGKLNEYFSSILQYKAFGNRDALDSVLGDLEKIDLDKIYNSDYKARILGMTALAGFYHGDRARAVRLNDELKAMTSDEELYWVVSALLEKDRAKRLDLLLEGKDKVFSIDRLDIFLADALMENGRYGEAAAIYDTILLEKSGFSDYFQGLRDLAYLFMKNPPSSYETGLILAKREINMEGLVDAVYLETDYFSSYDKGNIWPVLLEKKYFFDPATPPRYPLLRKDLAYFLFALIADRKNDSSLWDEYDTCYNSDLTGEMKDQMAGLSLVPDIPPDKYYFYPVLYLVEDQILELPDGENFFPEDLVSGPGLIETLGNLKKRLD